MQAERLRYDSDARFDLEIRARMDRCEFVDFVDPGSLSPFAFHTDRRLDRHRLDVALSRGRHAAERAKLAGCRTLICLGIGAENSLDEEARALDTSRQPCQTAATRPEYVRFARHDSIASRQAAYATLRQIARFEIAALAGALIAGAQMGLQAHPNGCHARAAARIALAINPPVRDWLVFAWPGSVGSGGIENAGAPVGQARLDGPRIHSSANGAGEAPWTHERITTRASDEILASSA